MKKIITAVIAAALCAVLLCACGNDENSTGSSSEAQSQGNAASFNETQSRLAGVLAGAWINQDDLNDKIKISEDLSIVCFDKADRHKGKASIDDSSGMLTIHYDDGFADDRTYVWVDSKNEVNSNTWYVDGGTFAYGGRFYIKDMEI